jgi:hypothetical protein
MEVARSLAESLPLLTGRRSRMLRVTQVAKASLSHGCPSPLGSGEIEFEEHPALHRYIHADMIVTIEQSQGSLPEITLDNGEVIRVEEPVETIMKLAGIELAK